MKKKKKGKKKKLSREGQSWKEKMTKNRCKLCDVVGDESGQHLCQLEALQQLDSSTLAGGFATFPATFANYANSQHAAIYLQQLKDMMLAAYLLKGNFLFLLKKK